MSIPNRISSFFHCRRCLEELPKGVAPREWLHLEIGWTEKGVQVWCVRHEMNVAHIDFMGQKVTWAA